MGPPAIWVGRSARRKPPRVTQVARLPTALSNCLRNSGPAPKAPGPFRHTSCVQTDLKLHGAEELARSHGCSGLAVRALVREVLTNRRGLDEAVAALALAGPPETEAGRQAGG